MPGLASVAEARSWTVHQQRLIFFEMCVFSRNNIIYIKIYLKIYLKICGVLIHLFQDTLTWRYMRHFPYLIQTFCCRVSFIFRRPMGTWASLQIPSPVAWCLPWRIRHSWISAARPQALTANPWSSKGLGLQDTQNIKGYLFLNRFMYLYFVSIYSTSCISLVSLRVHKKNSIYHEYSSIYVAFRWMSEFICTMCGW